MLHTRLDQVVQPARPAVQASEPARAVAARRRVAQLFDEQRVAAGVARDLGRHERVGAGQAGGDGLCRFGVAQGHQLNRLRCGGRAGADFVAGRAAGAARRQHDEQPAVGEPVQRRQHLFRRVVGPLQVVDEQQQGLLFGEPGEARAEGLGGVGQGLWQGIAAACLQHVAKRLQRLGPQVFAIAAQHVPALLRGAAEQLLDHSRLADASGSRHRHRTGRAGHRLRQQLFQLFEVGLSTDKGCQAVAGASLETRRQAGAGIDPVDQDRRVAALHLQRLWRAGDEESARRAECFFADQDLVRRGRIRQA